jgi:hypothetical protein
MTVIARFISVLSLRAQRGNLFLDNNEMDYLFCIDQAGFACMQKRAYQSLSGARGMPRPSFC